MDAPDALHFFDRYDRFKSAGDARRSHHRYEAIISSNQEVFQGARVLNLNSGDGRWCMAALDAGAVRVVGVDTSRKSVDTARSTLIEYGIDLESCQFVNSDINAALQAAEPGEFDLVLCAQAFEMSDPRVVFGYLYRLGPRHVILDTTVSRGEGPIVRFALMVRDPSAPKGTRRHGAIASIPNHDLMAFLSDYFHFGWRLIDWQAMGITDWSGIQDYERGRRCTYVLNRL
jgi:2-polyprenyl-3-methyl-5-hydroxy-6-metoxy-1,4-benzoquinol methylase